jgi:hypothetical protein
MESQLKRFRKDVCRTKQTPKFALQEYQLRTLFPSPKKSFIGTGAAKRGKGCYLFGNLNIESWRPFHNFVRITFPLPQKLIIRSPLPAGRFWMPYTASGETLPDVFRGQSSRSSPDSECRWAIRSRRFSHNPGPYFALPRGLRRFGGLGWQTALSPYSW